MKRFLVLAAYLLVAAFFAAPGIAAGLPDKEIRMLVAYKPGGQSDLIARKVSGIIEQNKFFQYPVVVNNIPGSGTRDALRTLRDAKADGSTVLMHHNALLTMRSMNLLPWDYTEFTCIAQVTEAPMVVVVENSKPWKSFAELLADAKANPNKYSFALQGMGGNGHLITEKILQMSKAQFKRISYEGGGDSIAAQLGGHVDVRVSSLVETISYMRAGQFRVLAVSSEQRLPEIPEVPTLQESGIDIVFTIKNGVLGPKNMPTPALRELEAIIKKTVESDGFKSFCRENYMQPSFKGSVDYTAAFAKDWAIFKELGPSLIAPQK
ncbi:MAG: tripartite tricarboxylate transporter substrate binding protein [Desulfovibrionaceae bacterium]|nr:tripartite tricarboxylate transporter substrate binding protein [Desulfovibrionaceae bacterium]